jgi:lipopolysaccharide export system permease protein
MSWSWTLYRYLAMQFLINVAGTYALFLALALSIDIVNLLERTAGHNVASSVAIGMAILQLPDLGQKFLPFAILLGGVLTFIRLSRSRELVATRAAGVSAWDFLLPPLTVAVFIGVFAVTLFTPISAKMFSEFAELEARYVKGQESQLSVSINGLWLRQGDRDQQSVIHALRVARQGEDLQDVLVFLYGPDDRFLGRIDAQSAQLQDHSWIMKNAWVSDISGKAPVHHDSYTLATTLTPEQIVESSQSPDTLSFWDLPNYIRAAQAAGFSAVKYQLYLYTLYALPALFAAMVFMAASFSLQLGREGGMPRMILLSAAAGFGVYFFQDLTTVLGTAGAVPILLAATAPALASILIGMTLVFSQEDG